MSIDKMWAGVRLQIVHVLPLGRKPTSCCLVFTGQDCWAVKAAVHWGPVRSSRQLPPADIGLKAVKQGLDLF